MLTLNIEEREVYNDDLNEFVSIPAATIRLEHSLVSISKWESKWKVPFLGKEEKTPEQTLDYIKMMTITQNVDPMVYAGLTREHMRQINEYISDPMTATWFSEKDKKVNNGRVVTSELIYYWMIALNIPIEFQKWHLNKLMTLIQVCNEEQQPKKELNKKDLYARNRSLNAARKAAMHSKG